MTIETKKECQLTVEEISTLLRRVGLEVTEGHIKICKRFNAVGLLDELGIFGEALVVIKRPASIDSFLSKDKVTDQEKAVFLAIAKITPQIKLEFAAMDLCVALIEEKEKVQSFLANKEATTILSRLGKKMLLTQEDARILANALDKLYRFEGALPSPLSLRASADLCQKIVNFITSLVEAIPSFSVRAQTDFFNSNTPKSSPSDISSVDSPDRPIVTNT